MNASRGAEVAQIINILPDKVEWSASCPSYLSPCIIGAGGGACSRASLDTVAGQIYFLPIEGIKPWMNQLPVQSYQKQYLDF
jgi:hypothetical protein